MTQSQETGLSTVTIITILAGLAILLGIFITSTSNERSAPSSTQATSGAEAIAQNIAENKTEMAVEAMEDKQAVLDQALEMNDLAAAPETDTTEAAMIDDEPVAPIPESEPEPVTVAAAGTFSTYDESKLSADGTNVLFFHAAWCPSCRGLESDLTTNASDIPENVTILKLDYDSETELKSKYGVIRQHTLVVVDADGNEIKKLTGLTNTLEQVVSQL